MAGKSLVSSDHSTSSVINFKNYYLNSENILVALHHDCDAIPRVLTRHAANVVLENTYERIIVGDKWGEKVSSPSARNSVSEWRAMRPQC